MKNLINKYTLIVFDLDGTLVHTTAEYRYSVVPKVIQKLGQDPNKIALKDVDKFWFDGERNTTIKQCFKVDPYFFWKTFHKYDVPKERKRYTMPYEDVLPALNDLKEKGKILAVTTGAPKWIAQMEISLLPPDLFTKVISVTSTRYKNKPHPQSLLACIRFCKKNVEESLYIGNSDDDAIYAKAANVDFLYIGRRKHSFSRSKVATIHSLLDLV